ncbi:MAG: hypothetical protein LPK45_05545 [Bacteroidota bacterium]|nr:hypothetical protein [Bacteroidota bacterium]MDX5430531.1 hypothetical protein [Bacteroidota bacterium]MDX5469284.1 hypothetical protein [Bacteroidota bacterium]
MKKIYITLLSAAFSLFAQAQSYSFFQQNGPYEELKNDIILMTDSAEVYKVFKIPPYFRSFGHDLGDSVMVSQNGNTYMVTDYKGFGLNPFWTQMHLSDEDAKVSYQIEGPDGEHILKIQWKQLEHNGDELSRLNFQLWVYEKDQTIEFHFGPGSVEGEFSCGLFLFTSNFSHTLETITAGGSPDNPTIENHSVNFLTSFPEEGTIYRFAYLHAANPEINKTELIAFPNPCSGQFRVSEPGAEVLFIIDALGKKQVFEKMDDLIVLGNKSPGIYQVVIMRENQSLEVHALEVR